MGSTLLEHTRGFHNATNTSSNTGLRVNPKSMFNRHYSNNLLSTPSSQRVDEAVLETRRKNKFLYKICSTVRQNDDTTCYGRCGSRPQIISDDFQYLKCACDKLCWINGDCSNGISKFLSFSVARGSSHIATFVQGAHSLFS